MQSKVDAAKLPSPQSLPLAQLWRRFVALVIDLSLAGLLSVPLASGAPESLLQLWVFLILWIGFRVVLVLALHGQSPGRWFLHLKIIEISRGRTPRPETLLVREFITGILYVLLVIGLKSALQEQLVYGWVMTLPALANGMNILLHPRRHPLYDRLLQIRVVPTRRGLEIRNWLKRFLA